MIDSGATITVHAGAKGDIDTYVVVQTICGNIKTDTVLIHTVGLGMQEEHLYKSFSIYPNPSDGIVAIIPQNGIAGEVIATVYDVLGRRRLQQALSGGSTRLQLMVPPGIYILELRSATGDILQRSYLQVQ